MMTIITAPTRLTATAALLAVLEDHEPMEHTPAEQEPAEQEVETVYHHEAGVDTRDLVGRALCGTDGKSVTAPAPGAVTGAGGGGGGVELS